MPFYLMRFSYTPDAWARLIQKPEDRPGELIWGARRDEQPRPAIVNDIRAPRHP